MKCCTYERRIISRRITTNRRRIRRVRVHGGKISWDICLNLPRTDRSSLYPNHPLLRNLIHRISFPLTNMTKRYQVVRKFHTMYFQTFASRILRETKLSFFHSCLVFVLVATVFLKIQNCSIICRHVRVYKSLRIFRIVTFTGPNETFDIVSALGFTCRDLMARKYDIFLN